MIKQEWRAELLSLCEEYCALTGISKSTLAHKCAGDGDYFDRLGDGGGCTVDKYLQVKEWFKSNMPPQKKRRR